MQRNFFVSPLILITLSFLLSFLEYTNAEVLVHRKSVDLTIRPMLTLHCTKIHTALWNQMKMQSSKS